MAECTLLEIDYKGLIELLYFNPKGSGTVDDLSVRQTYETYNSEIVKEWNKYDFISGGASYRQCSA